MVEDLGPIGLLKTLSDGRVIDDFYDRLGELLLAVRMSHKKGKVVLTVSVAPSNDPESIKVSIRGDVTAKLPHIERGGELFYLDDRNQLSRRNPLQPELPANTVRMPAKQEAEIDRQSLAAGEKA